jgi:hypothetical protein
MHANTCMHDSVIYNSVGVFLITQVIKMTQVKAPRGRMLLGQVFIASSQ